MVKIGYASFQKTGPILHFKRITSKFCNKTVVHRKISLKVLSMIKLHEEVQSVFLKNENLYHTLANQKEFVVYFYNEQEED